MDNGKSSIEINQFKNCEPEINCENSAQITDKDTGAVVKVD